jgi:hypothetical protein
MAFRVGLYDSVETPSMVPVPHCLTSCSQLGVTDTVTRWASRFGPDADKTSFGRSIFEGATLCLAR